jgi:hypothetical protein
MNLTTKILSFLLEFVFIEYKKNFLQNLDKLILIKFPVLKWKLPPSYVKVWTVNKFNSVNLEFYFIWSIYFFSI